MARLQTQRPPRRSGWTSACHRAPCGLARSCAAPCCSSPSARGQAAKAAGSCAKFAASAPSATRPATQGTARELWESVPVLVFLGPAPKIAKMQGTSKETGLHCAVGGGLVRARPPPTLLTSGCASVPRGVVLAFAGDRRGLMKESCLAGGAQEGSEVAPCCLSGVCGAPEFAVWMWRCRAGLCCEMCAVSVSKSASISAELC